MSAHVVLSRVTVALLVLVASILTGCIGSNVQLDGASDDAASGVTAFTAPDGSKWALSATAGGVSTLTLTDGEGAVAFEEGTLVVTADGRLVPAEKVNGHVLAAGETLAFVPSPGTANVTLTLGGETMKFATPRDGARLLDGAHVVELIRYQEENFPNRRPGSDSYPAAQAYFKEYFEALGYEVEVDPYGTMAFDGTRLPAGATRGIGPSSVANVVAYKRGTLAESGAERFIVFGGHYDVVEETTHGAFDNTGGTMAVLEMARAFQNVTTSHTLVFGLWGGEEDGILGSRFWVESNPEKVPFITAAINLDVTGLAWPGPAPNPDPFLVTAGPDGVHSDTLLAEAEHIVQSYAKFTDAPALYQPMVVGGQVGGAGVNAQSDHTSFASKGIPSFMFSTGNMDVVFSMIHSEADTLDNMTAYMVTGQSQFGEALTEEEMAEGRELLARSYETQMWIPFYYAVLADSAYAEA